MLSIILTIYIGDAASSDSETLAIHSPKLASRTPWTNITWSTIYIYIFMITKKLVLFYTLLSYQWEVACLAPYVELGENSKTAILDACTFANSTNHPQPSFTKLAPYLIDGKSMKFPFITCYDRGKLVSYIPTTASMSYGCLLIRYFTTCCRQIKTMLLRNVN